MKALRRVALALLLLAGTQAPAAAVERITRFVSDVDVQKNGDLLVTETIRVIAEGREIRRGILRDFPTTYSGRDGARVQVGFDVLSVQRNGAPENFSTENLSNGVRIRIGRADRLIPNGPHEYTIRYRTTRQLGYFADFDELYWNATGTGWTFAIEVAEARIRLPERVPFRQTAIYTGPQGARDQDATIVEREPGRIVFRTTRPLPPRNGLTVAAAWPKGVVTQPDALQQAGWWLEDNRAVMVAIVGLALVLGFYGFAWLRVGRDPPRGTIIPLFGPPDGMSAAAVRFVRDMGFDNRCYTAAILELAVNGHLKLVDVKEGTEIHRQDKGRPVGPAEAAAEKELFASEDSLLLKDKNHVPLGKARDALKESLSETYIGKLFANNFGWSGIGLLLSLALIAAIVWQVLSTFSADRSAGFVVGMLLPVPAAAIGAGMFGAGWRRGSRWLPIGGLLLAAVFIAVGLVFMIANARGWVELAPGLAAIAVSPVAALAFGWLQAPSKVGRAIQDKIEGFKQYLGVAEEDRLEFLHPPKKTPELFERFLPYAIALDVENTWAKRFAGVLAAAATEAAVASWYVGQQSMSRDPVGFVDRLGSELSQTIASASSPPGSSNGGSGSSGGGSSGGGGGGGGGSGW